MNKSDLINAIAEHANLTKADAGRALEGLLITIETALKAGDPVVLIGFGTFAVKEKELSARVAIHKPVRKSLLQRQKSLPLNRVKA